MIHVINVFWVRLLAAIVFPSGPIGKAPGLPAKPFASDNTVDKPSEEELRIAKEREASFLKAIADHQGLIHKICRSWCRKREDHEDLYMEIVYQLWKTYLTFRGESKLSTWIHEVAVRSAKLPFRRKRIKTEYTDDLPEPPAAEPFDDGFDDRMFSIFRDLDLTNRSILVFTLEGFADKEIGRSLHLTQNQVAKRKTKIRQDVTRTK